MRHSPPDAEWLRTEEYQTLMNCFLTGKPDQNEAEM